MMSKSQITINPVTPGEILLEEFLKPLGLSARKLALHIDLPPNRITEIIRGRRRITADTAIRLGIAFGTTPDFWLNLQKHFDLEVEKDRLSQQAGWDDFGRIVEIEENA